MQLRDLINIIEEAMNDRGFDPNKKAISESIRQGDYEFVTNCVMCNDGDEINEMADRAREITYATFVKAVGIDQLKEIFYNYDWSRRPTGLTMARDYHVRYFKSTWHGTRCVYAVHSAIEYIFVKREDLPKLDGKKI